MSAARTISARVATLAVMAGSVVMLTNLFGGGAQRQLNLPATTESKEAATVFAMADGWRGEINFAPAYAALNPYAEGQHETITSRFDPSDDYWGLPRNSGYETVSAYCGACHTLQIVMAQRQSREGWDYLLNWMVEKQGMAPPSPETREEILNYLSATFAE
ncbi:hypothetical protein [Hyphococcus sp.]|uniref:hypothetical protein n=1 Tax=Hyphococcus sp. TaxID=2038636 RepID=UPI00208944E6|nr:MAG: hypothetical protein DHS20C04_17470 [Marinicaulis sp.]